MRKGKLFYSILMCLILVFAQNTFVSAQTTLGQFNIPISVNVNNGTCTFTMIENPSTGYTWDYSCSQEGIVKLESHSLLSTANNAHGAAGTAFFIFKGITHGFTNITFTYHRPWVAQYLVQETFRVSVDTSGKIISVYSLEDENQVHPTIHNGICTFAMFTNPSTGYSWAITPSSNNCVELESTDYIPVNNDPNIVGSGSTYFMNYKGIREGSTTLTFLYRRPWETNKPIYQESYIIYVNEDLEITSATKIGTSVITKVSTTKKSI